MEFSSSPSRRERIRTHLFVVTVAVGCGLAAALGAVLFRGLIHGFEAVFFGADPLAVSGRALVEGTFRPEANGPLAPGLDLACWRRFLAPILGGALVGPLVVYLAREARGHGVPEVMEAVALRGGVIRPRVVAIKALASAITIGSGGSVGREGPIVQIGSALGSTIGQLLRLPARGLRTLVACGAAAGIAATFNAPIAGALFAMEVILADFATMQLAPVVIASVVATVVARAFLGDHPSFTVPSWNLESPEELVAYALLGVVAALVGVGFGSVLHASERGFERLRVPDVAKPAIGGAAVGLVGIGLPHVFGSGYGTIDAALAGTLPWTLLCVLLFAKIAATSVTLGSGGSGGIFAPSLFLGAVTGGAFGSAVHALFPDVTATSGAYALVAMGAVVSATTHAPITAIIMIFEMTQSITIIPPLMASCVIATLFAMFLRRESIYTMRLAQRGIDFYAERDPNVLRAMQVREVLDPKPERLPASAPFREVLDLVVRSPHAEFFVADDAGRLLGAISLTELRRLFREEEALRDVVVAADLIDPRRPVLHEDDDLDTALQLLHRAGAAELAVVAREAPSHLVGSVSERDVVEAYHRELMRRDLAGGISRRISLTDRSPWVDLGGGFVLAEVDAPPSFAGHSLRELDLRARYDVQVLLIRPAGRSEVRVPGPAARVDAGDKLVLAGPQPAVERLEREG